MNEQIEHIRAFLHRIGIELEQAELPDDTFLPGVRIQGARLDYDPRKLAWPGDLLHEAGHIAVTPGDLRSDLVANVNQSPGYGEHFNGEIEAIAWSYAACLHIGMDVRDLFHADGYKGQAAALLNNFTIGVYIGLHGLQQAKLAVAPQQAQAGQAAYPDMLRWVRE